MCLHVQRRTNQEKHQKHSINRRRRSFNRWREREREREREKKRKRILAIDQMWCNLHLDYEFGFTHICKNICIYYRPTSKVITAWSKLRKNVGRMLHLRKTEVLRKKQPFFSFSEEKKIEFCRFIQYLCIYFSSAQNNKSYFSQCFLQKTKFSRLYYWNYISLLYFMLHNLLCLL